MTFASKPVIDIRPSQLSDAGAIAAIYEPVVRDTAISFELDPPTAQVMQERIRMTLLRYPWLTAECAGEIVGYAFASQHRDRPAYRGSTNVEPIVFPELMGG